MYVCIWSTFFVPGIVLNAKDTEINNADPALKEVTVYERKLRCNRDKAHCYTAL